MNTDRRTVSVSYGGRNYDFIYDADTDIWYQSADTPTYARWHNGDPEHIAGRCGFIFPQIDARVTVFAANSHLAEKAARAVRESQPASDDDVLADQMFGAGLCGVCGGHLPHGAFDECGGE